MDKIDSDKSLLKEKYGYICKKSKTTQGKFKLIINKIPDGILLEDTLVFKSALNRFSKYKKRKVQDDDLKNDLKLLGEFEDYMLSLLLTNPDKLAFSVDKKLSGQVQSIIRDYKNRCFFTIKNIDNYYVQIRRKLFPENLYNLKEATLLMRPFTKAYNLMKETFEGRFRQGKDKNGDIIRYFEHLKGAMEIVLNELPNPNINTIIIAILHDVVEDIEGYSVEEIEKDFGKYIANGVGFLSKKPLEYYLSDYDKKRLHKMKKNSSEYIELIKKAKELKTKDYFGHLNKLNDDYLAVKFADRIHNLRTSDVPGMSTQKIIRKVKETEKYFLGIAKKRNRIAYELMIIEIEKLKLKYKF